MIKTISSRDSAQISSLIAGRSAQASDEITKTVEAIIADVKANGDLALKKYTKQFDGAELSSFEVEKSQIDAAYESADPELISAMSRAAENIRDFHKRQIQPSWTAERECGVVMGRNTVPLKRVALYVPGGRAAYPSSVLMNAIPAKIAGVPEVYIITPVGRDGKLSENILAAAKIAGVDKIYTIGGAQAVAAAAWGTQTIPRADKIVGPGNIFVATAKRLLYGVVDIDMVAGPSEVLVIADKSADPAFTAADMLSQAEHDVMASAILLCLSDDFADRVKKELAVQTSRLPRREIIKASLRDYSRIVVCSDMDECIKLANEIAPEHLEIMAEDPEQYLGLIRNAGTVFLGAYTPEPIGDYFAGPSHVLPTGGSARFFSGLSVDSFIKKVNFIKYTREALLRDAHGTVIFAQAEGFDAHANSVAIRTEEEKR